MIRRDQQIAGMPAADARELMRKIGASGVTASFVDDVLGDGWDGRRVIEDLEALGFVGRVDPSLHHMVRFGSGDNRVDVDVWGTTVAGNALAKARIGKPISRRRAQDQLDGLLARVAAVNDDPQGVFVVEQVAVFGSFAAGEADQVGDVDVSLVFDRRVTGDRFMELAEEAAREAELKGKRFRSFLDRLTILDQEFRRNLRGSSGRLDIQFSQAGSPPLLPEGVGLVVVYRREP